MTLSNYSVLACWFLIGLILGACLQMQGGESQNVEVFYVNNKIGSDTFDGRSAELGAGNAGPFKTIMQAVRKCSDGAHIEIANTGIDYRETVEISGLKKGRAETPLIIDGHGAIVNGLLPIATEQWQHFRDDIYYFANRVGGADYKPRGWYDKKFGDSYYGPMPRNVWLTGRTGWFTEKESPKAPQIFLVNGKPGPNVVKLDDLPPGGFFYDVKRTIQKDLPRCLFFRLPENKELKDCVVELPQNDGIFINDDYVTVQNIGSCYGVEDGFHGWSGQNVVFRNIHSFCNSEQGMSFHSIGTTFVDDGLIENNGGSGIVDVMSSMSVYRNVTVRNNSPLGVIFKGVAHAMYDCKIEKNGGTQILIEKNTAANLVNCLIVAMPNTIGVDMDNARLERCTIVNANLGVKVTTGVKIANSIIADCKINLAISVAALENTSLTGTILGDGKIEIGGKLVAQADWTTAAKGVKTEELVFANAPMTLVGPLYLLSPDSPYAKKNKTGFYPGACLNMDKK